MYAHSVMHSFIQSVGTDCVTLPWQGIAWFMVTHGALGLAILYVCSSLLIGVLTCNWDKSIAGSRPTCCPGESRSWVADLLLPDLKRGDPGLTLIYPRGVPMHLRLAIQNCHSKWGLLHQSHRIFVNAPSCAWSTATHSRSLKRVMCSYWILCQSRRKFLSIGSLPQSKPKKEKPKIESKSI